jgi:hypothetical protein
MTDTSVAIQSPADTQRARIEKTAADATAQLEQMRADYRQSSAAVVEGLRAELEALDNDPLFLGQELGGRHAGHRAILRSRLAGAEARAATAIREAFSPEARVDNAMAGVTDHAGIEVTVDGQIPSRDFTNVIQDDLALGINPDLVRAFHTTGKSTDPLGHVAAELWLGKFNSTPEWQARLAAGDRLMQQRFRAASMYIAGKHADVDPVREAEHRAQLINSSSILR